MSKKVVVVDDSYIMRTLVTNIVTADPDFEVVGSASNGVLGLEAVKKIQPGPGAARYRNAGNGWAGVSQASQADFLSQGYYHFVGSANRLAASAGSEKIGCGGCHCQA